MFCFSDFENASQIPQTLFYLDFHTTLYEIIFQRLGVGPRHDLKAMCQ